MAMVLQRQGLIYPISDSKTVNLKNREAVAGVTPMYNGFVESYMTINGKQYGWQYGRPNDGWGTAMIFFNSQHLVNAGLGPEYIYDLQKSNNWTWTTFHELCKRLRRGSTFAIACDDPRDFIKSLVFGNGGNFVTFDAQGRAQNGTNSPAFIEALQFYNQLITEGLIMTQPNYDWGWNWSAFMDGRVSMTFDPEWRKAQMNDRFTAGYVLAPRGPRANNLRVDAIDTVLVIPSIFSPAEVDVILRAAEYWFVPHDTDWLEDHYWASRNMRDVNETVVMSRDINYITPRNFALIPDFPFDDFVLDFRDGLGRTNPTQYVAQWAPRINAVLNDFNRGR